MIGMHGGKTWSMLRWVIFRVHPVIFWSIICESESRPRFVRNVIKFLPRESSRVKQRKCVEMLLIYIESYSSLLV